MTRTLPLAALGLVLSTPAAAATWQIDPSHSTVGFKVRHMMISWVQGQFNDFSGTVEYDPARPTDTSAQVSVQIASVDTDEPKRDAHLVSPDFFDATQFPTMSFTSTKVKKAKDGQLELVGDLTMRGVTKPVTLTVDGLGQPIIDPWGNYRVGATVSGTIDRQAFGVSWNDSLDAGGVVVGDEVQLVIDVQLTRPVEQEAKR